MKNLKKYTEHPDADLVKVSLPKWIPLVMSTGLMFMVGTALVTTIAPLSQLIASTIFLGAFTVVATYGISLVIFAQTLASSYVFPDAGTLMKLFIKTKLRQRFSQIVNMPNYYNDKAHFYTEKGKVYLYRGKVNLYQGKIVDIKPDDIALRSWKKTMEKTVDMYDLKQTRRMKRSMDVDSNDSLKSLYATYHKTINKLISNDFPETKELSYLYDLKSEVMNYNLEISHVKDNYKNLLESLRKDNAFASSVSNDLIVLKKNHERELELMYEAREALMIEAVEVSNMAFYPDEDFWI